MTPRRDSAGFTLVELLITSIIVGIVTFAVGTALLIGIKTTFETGERLGQSNSSQQLGQYLLPDIASAAPGGVNTLPGAPFGCSGPAPAGPSVLALSWTDEFTGSATRAVYRYEAPDLVRYACTPGGSPSRTTVARDLKLAPVAVPIGTAVALTATVVQQQSSGDDYTFTVRASLRTPAGGCEPEQSSLVITPVPVALSGSNLAEELTVTFGTSGPCTAATVDYQYGSTAATRPATATLVGPGNWKATVPSGGGGWTAGLKDLVVRAGGQSATTTFLVYDPGACVITGGPTASPNPANRSGASLVAPVAVTWTTAGLCSNSGSLIFQHGATTTESGNVPAMRSGSTWTASAPASLGAASWTDGAKAITVAADVATASGSFTVVPAPVCAILTNPTASPANVALTKGYVNSGRSLTSNVVVTFTTSTSCTGVSLDYSYGADASVVANFPAAGSGGSWSVTIPSLAPGTAVWTTGVKALTARTGALSRTGSFTVTSGCGVASPLTFSPIKGKMANPVKLVGPITVTFTTSPGCAAADFVLRYQHEATVAGSSVAAVTGGPTSWTATLPDTLPSSTKWSSGTKQVTVTVGVPGDEVVTTTSLVVDPP